MNKKTFGLTIILSISLSVSGTLKTHATTERAEEKAAAPPLRDAAWLHPPLTAPISDQARKKLQQLMPDTIPFFNGIYVGVELVGMVGSLLGSDTKSIEVQADVNLKNRFFPVLEVGYSSTDAVSDYGTHYQTQAPYFRAGLNYKLKYRNTSESHLFVGARYAVSFFKYDVESLEITDPIWGGTSNPNLSDDIWGGSVSFRVTGENSHSHWMELVGGIRVQIWKQLMAGWSIRYKQRFSVKKGEYSEPAFIPGFGETRRNTFGITYSLIYKLPVGK